MATENLDIIIRAKGDQARKEIGLLEKSMGGLKAAGTVVAAGLAVAGSAAVAFGISAVKAASEAETEFALYSKVLKQAAGASDEQVKALEAQADATGRLGGVSKEAVMQIQRTTGEYFLSTDAIGKLTPAITDYIAVQYGANASTEQARNIANGFGKAMQGQMDILTKAGFVATEHQKAILENGDEMARVAVITEILGSGYEGANKALSETAEGGLRRVTTGLKDIQENIGKFLLPLMTPLIEKVAEITGKILVWSESLGSVNDVLTNTQNALNGMKDGFLDAVKAFDEQTGIITAVKDAFRDIWAQLSGELMPALRELWEANKPFLPYYQALGKLLATVVVIAIRTLIEVIKGVIQVMISLATFATQMGTAMLNAAKFAIEPMTKFVDGLTSSLKSAVQWLKNVAAWSDTMRTKASDALKQIPLVGGLASKAITGRAVGGTVMRGQPYMVGEKGPEMFVPGQTGTIIPNGRGGTGGSTFNFTFHGDVVDRESFIKDVTDAVNRSVAAPTASQAW